MFNKSVWISEVGYSLKNTKEHIFLRQDLN